MLLQHLFSPGRSMRRGTMVAALILIGFPRGSLAGSAEFHLRDGDTVVFYGDSITNQRLYTVFTEAYVVTRFPRLRVRFINSGWGGDRVSGGGGGSIDVRLQRDVFAYHPSVVTVMLGMNDGEYRPFDSGIFDRFANGYRHIAGALEATLPHSRLTLLASSPYDDVTRPPNFEGGYNAVLVRLGDFVQQVAKTDKLSFSDLNSPVVRLLRDANERSTKQAQTLIPDRVHPSEGVHLVMTETLLRAWNAPSLVTSVEIDASTGLAGNVQNTTVDSVSLADGLSWRQDDRALPMPVDTTEPTAALALACSDFTRALNQEILKVKGLANGRYALRIDGERIGSFDADQMEQGVNLAELPTPMSRQAASVLSLTHRHNHLHFARWRLIEQALNEYDLRKLKPALDALDALEDEVVSLQRATAQPKPHEYQLLKE